MAQRATPVRAERLRPALQPRVLGRAGLHRDRSFRVLHLARGSASFRDGDRTEKLTAPVVGWFPWRDRMRLRLDAGAQGTQLVLDQSALEQALRRRPEAGQLRFMADRVVHLRLPDDGAEGDAVTACIAAIEREAHAPAAFSPAVIESLLHVLLIHLHRGQPQAVETGVGHALGDRFATLVEAHFRDHWKVQHYAAALDISRDRLHDICLRAHRRTPGALIRARLHLEARLYLENAPLSLDQIAGLLGFSGAAQFNRFFRVQEGMPPGRYRASVARRGDRDRATETAPYAWP